MREGAQWGVDSEHGRLTDVLLCPPDNFEWRKTSPISEATLASGREFDPDRARGQHAEMVAAYESAGVRCHFLEPDPGLPYQVFTRDSSTMTPWGAVVNRLRQDWRRGEDEPVKSFYESEGIPVAEQITEAALEGGDVVIVAPGQALIGNGEARTQEPAARQLAAFFERGGWEARIEQFPEQYVHIDVLVSVLADGLAAVCTEIVAPSLTDWLRGARLRADRGLRARTPSRSASTRSRSGADRVLSAAGVEGAQRSDERRTAWRSLDVELAMFTLGGGGAHCLGLALRRGGRVNPSLGVDR